MRDRICYLHNFTSKTIKYLLAISRHHHLSDHPWQSMERIALMLHMSNILLTTARFVSMSRAR